MDTKKFSEGNTLQYRDKEVIFREGDETQEMYIVQSGEVVVSKKTAQGEVELGVVRRGEFLGEMSLLESLPRSATAHSRGDTKLFAIQPGGFLLKIRRDPTFAFEMMQVLSKRIRFTNERLMRHFSDPEKNQELLKILSQAEFK